MKCAAGEGVPKDEAEAIKWFRRAAEQGDDDAQFVLGVWYDEGRRVPSNFAEALKWYRLAAEQGNAGAQLNLGVMYAHGKGIPRNNAEAAKWYRLAADQGLANAEDALGSLYFLGEGVPKSSSQAVKWFRQAADEGYAEAQKHLGLTYASGDGIPQNYTRAYMWLSLAAAQDDKDAATQRDKVAQLMPPSQVAEAQRLALEWQPLSTKGSATATKIPNLRELCAARRDEMQDLHNKANADTETDIIYASNFNNITNRCYILMRATVRGSSHREMDGTYSDLYDLQIIGAPAIAVPFAVPIAHCRTGLNADEASFTPAGKVTAKGACAFIDKMMHDDSDTGR